MTFQRLPIVMMEKRKGGVNFWPTTPPRVRRVWVESLQDAQDIASTMAVSGNIGDSCPLDKSLYWR
ncbi:MAG: hypothetical protein CFE34_03035 [Rhodobacteraceae bacterium PARR1]|nr:MAG: hypothetical protein CFE34_03035 [Rhodobacteraceae bacterium PARR1]